MCALILFHDPGAEYPLLLAGNRDEWKDRPALPPELVAGPVPYVAPRDLKAGGSWIGVNRFGVAAGITNRRERQELPDLPLPSRGALVRAVLEARSAAAARERVEAALSSAPLNPFNLVYADARAAFLTRGGQAVETLPLAPGAHLVTNLHELDELEVIEVDRLAAAARESPLLETVAGLVDFLRGTDPITGDGFRPCKDDGDRGTRSSTIIAPGAALHGDAGAVGLFLYADGPPDRTPFLDFGHLLRAMLCA